MSNVENIPPPRPSPAQRSGCLTALMVIVGIALLLPGSCVLMIVLTSFSEVRRYLDSEALVLILIVALLGAAGVFLIQKAIRGSRTI